MQMVEAFEPTLEEVLSCLYAAIVPDDTQVTPFANEVEALLYKYTRERGGTGYTSVLEADAERIEGSTPSAPTN